MLQKAGHLARAPNMVPAVRPAITDHLPTVTGACCKQHKALKPCKAQQLNIREGGKHFALPQIMPWHEEQHPTLQTL